jgi:hypothetical protein
MNVLLQHRGHVLMSAGHSIAVQNFNENLFIIGMLVVYLLKLKRTVCMSSRREFLKAGALGLGAALAGGYPYLSQAAPSGPLIEGMRTLCRRLAPAGWRDMLLDVTGGQFDMLAADLQAELAKRIAINRRYPGFGDFGLAGSKAIEPGQPDYSLLYHALAAPSVLTGRNNAPLTAFPTLAELETVENYIYASRQISLAAIRASFTAPMAVVMFATQYRNAPMGVSGRHAQLCFARCGVARIGNLAPRWDGPLRSFTGISDRPFDFHVVPRRFTPYLAVQLQTSPGGPGLFGPQDMKDGDTERKFWVPLHKLFSGPECLAGMNLNVSMSRGLVNDELGSFHRFLDKQKLKNNFSGAHLEQFPFTIRDEKIASLAMGGDYGPGVLVPRATPMVEEARYQGARLTFPVDPAYSGRAANIQMSSLFVLPGGAAPVRPGYLNDAEQWTERAAPEYINIRHRVVNGQVENLNERPDLFDVMAKGNYEAQHYIDFTGDGWVVANCPELAQAGVGVSKPAFSMVGLPDFLPKVGQRELMLWWTREVPAELRDALWATPPLALSQTRIAGNVELPIGFSIDDDTVSAIVSAPQTFDGATVSNTRQAPNGTLRFDKVGLPDGSPGLFDPGWDTSMGVRNDKGVPQRYLVGHGLGSPFIEDAKLCAALGSYWPGVAPDATRQYQPDKQLSGISYPWPTAVPFTDEEIGMVPVAEGPLKGKFLSWDGVPGPRRATFQGRQVVEYEDERRVDYIDVMGRMTASLTSRIDLQEYQQRTLSMAAVYWSLGIRGTPGSTDSVNQVLRLKAAWAVLSFRTLAANAQELLAAAAQANAEIDPQRRYYRFELFRWGGRNPNPARMRSVYVDILEEAMAYSDGKQVLLKRGGAWTLDATIPT